MISNRVSRLSMGIFADNDENERKKVNYRSVSTLRRFF